MPVKTKKKKNKNPTTTFTVVEGLEAIKNVFPDKAFPITFNIFCWSEGDEIETQEYISTDDGDVHASCTLNSSQSEKLEELAEILLERLPKMQVQQILSQFFQGVHQHESVECTLRIQLNKHMEFCIIGVSDINWFARNSYNAQEMNVQINPYLGDFKLKKLVKITNVRTTSILL